MKLAWVHYSWPAENGMARGYLASAYQLYRAIQSVMGSDLEDVAADGEPGSAHVHFHYCPPHFFRPFHVKHNVLMTMWEGLALPDEVQRALLAAEQLLVPSNFCARLWQRHGFDSEVVPLGLAREYLEADTTRRGFRGAGEGLRFLFVGSKANRKGWDVVGPAWRQAFPSSPHQCYVKIIGDGSLVRSGPVVVDQRDLEPREMLDLYKSADVFVSQSLTEGFGLPLLEAMAAGCLGVSTLAGGNEDFFGPGTGVIVARSRPLEIEYGGATFRLMAPSPADLASALRLVAGDWGTQEAEDARATGTAVARTFTWARSAASLLTAVDGVRPPARMPA